ncbi:hypothetical protein Tco_0739555 [Tanacetum coccineum]
MFTRSVVLRRRVEDLQLGVESYQKKLNLTRPDTYKSDLKQKTPYTTYSNPKGFIYHNKDKKNILMCIDELHKFSDGTLNDVRSALNDILKQIRMEVWKSVRYGVSKELDTAYWGFLGVGTTLDIFQNIIFIPYLEYGVLSLSGYGVLSFILCGLWHGYTVSSLMNTTYWSSE